MLIFLDESGDSGFKKARGSSSTFVITLVIFNDPLDAEETALTIKRLRRRLALRDEFEFKFSKCSAEFRSEFFQAVAGSPFRVRSLVVRKDVVESPELQKKRDSFYGYFVRQVIHRNKDAMTNAKLRIDGSGDRAFRQQLAAALRKEFNRNRMVLVDVRTQKSHNSVLIQLADMVAGECRRRHEGSARDANSYFGLLKEKIEDEWVFS